MQGYGRSLRDTGHVRRLHRYRWCLRHGWSERWRHRFRRRSGDARHVGRCNGDARHSGRRTAHVVVGVIGRGRRSFAALPFATLPFTALPLATFATLAFAQAVVAALSFASFASFAALALPRAHCVPRRAGRQYRGLGDVRKRRRQAQLTDVVFRLDHKIIGADGWFVIPFGVLQRATQRAGRICGSRLV